MIIQSLERTAHLAWNPVGEDILLATGTDAQQLSPDFSTTGHLEVVRPQLSSSSAQPDQGSTNPDVVVSLESPDRFHDLKWAAPASRENGLLVGAMDSGVIRLWDADALMRNDPNALLAAPRHHSGAVRGLALNRLEPHLLASIAADSEVYIMDLNKPEQHFAPGPDLQPPQAMTGVAWNCQVPYILATAGASGRTTIWDLRASKAIMTLSHNTPGFQPRSLAWNPDQGLSLIVASDSDATPVIQLWDLHNAQACVHQLQGHQKGVLSVAWCPQDSNLLLSGGKDNRALLWDPLAEAYEDQLLKELHPAGNWIFDVNWCPRNPSLVATAAFDGQVRLQSVEAGSEVATTNPQPVLSPRLGAHTPTSVGGQSTGQPGGSGHHHHHTPKWLKRPCGACFGFGGHLVRFSSESRRVQVFASVRDDQLATQADSLNKALAATDTQTLEQRTEALEQTGAAGAIDGDDVIWRCIVSSLDPQARNKYMGLLELSADTVAQEADHIASGVSQGPAVPPTLGDDLYDGCFNATPGTSEHVLVQALAMRQFDLAIDVCLAEDRMADALMLAIAAGPTELSRVQQFYFARTQSPSARLLRMITEERWLDIVSHMELAAWQDCMALLLTYAPANVMGDLSNALARRLQNQGDWFSACLCYVIAGALDDFGSCYGALLQDSDLTDAQQVYACVEKLTVLRRALALQRGQSPPVSPAYTQRVLALCSTLADQHDLKAAYGILSAAIESTDPWPRTAAPTLRTQLAVAAGAKPLPTSINPNAVASAQLRANLAQSSPGYGANAGPSGFFTGQPAPTHMSNPAARSPYPSSAMNAFSPANMGVPNGHGAMSAVSAAYGTSHAPATMPGGYGASGATPYQPPAASAPHSSAPPLAAPAPTYPASSSYNPSMGYGAPPPSRLSASASMRPAAGMTPPMGLPTQATASVAPITTPGMYAGGHMGANVAGGAVHAAATPAAAPVAAVAPKAKPDKRWNDPPMIMSRKKQQFQAPAPIAMPIVGAPEQAQSQPAASAMAAAGGATAHAAMGGAASPAAAAAEAAPAPAPEPEVPAEFQPLVEKFEALVDQYDARANAAQKRKLADVRRRLLSLKQVAANQYLDSETGQSMFYSLQYIELGDFANALAYQQYLTANTNPDVTGQPLMALKALINIAKTQSS